MKTVAVLLLALTAATPVVAQASETKTKVTERHGVVTTRETLKSGKHVEKVTCRAFNALDESFKPEAVGYAVEYGKRAKPRDVDVDVAGVERITPVVIETCKARPQETLLQRIKSVFHHGR